MEFDFGGYATKNGLRCADGRVIRKNAFASQNGMKVPLVWQHQRNDPSNVIGHAYLENRDDGVYAYCKLNESEKGKQTKLIVEHGDVAALSIFANNLVQKGSDVMHGAIREVSVVLAGANPGALIDNVVIQHSDGEEYEDPTRAMICSGEDISLTDVSYNLQHGDDDPDNDSVEHSDDETVEDVISTLTPKQRKAVEYIIGAALSEAEHSDDDAEDDDTVEHADSEDDDETVQDVYDSMTDKQKKVVQYIVGAALAEAEGEDDEDTETDDKSAQHDIEGGDSTMKKNVFDATQPETKATTSLTHDQFQEIVEDAKKNGSFRDSFLEHAQSYGIENIDILFPDAKSVTTEPALIKRDTEWVAGVLSETRHVPFSRVKSTAADLTADEARARGYVKGNLKKEEVIRLLKRVTNPTTVYKKQKLDRDDIVDITDLNVVAFLKAEMRVMLNEELARAFLVGDGRDAESDDKIDEECIRPIYTDDDMYAHHVVLESTTTPAQTVEQIIRARKYYKGSGSPTFYTTADNLVDMLLQVDGIGRRLYNSEAELAAALRVSKIVEVPVMEGLKRTITTGSGATATSVTQDLVGIIVNLRDYTVGATAGGNVSMFDDFDIDYNQYKYLLETRCSGALTLPKSALVFEKKQATTSAGGTTQTKAAKA